MRRRPGNQDCHSECKGEGNNEGRDGKGKEAGRRRRGGRRKGKAGSPIELRDNVPDLTDDDDANKLTKAARGMARIASSATATFRIPPPLPPPAGYCRGMPPDGSHVDLRTMSS